MQPGLVLPGQLTNRTTRVVANDEHHLRFGVEMLLPQPVGTGERHVLTLLPQRLLVALPLLLESDDILGQVVGHDGAEGRVRGPKRR